MKCPHCGKEVELKSKTSLAKPPGVKPKVKEKK